MTFSFKSILSLAAILALIILTAMSIVAYTNKAFGSIESEAGGYYSTSTPKAVNYTAGAVVLKGGVTRGFGVLGSVLFTGAPKGGRITLYDATTTNVNLRTGNKATSSIILAEFDPGQATSSVYVFDTVFNDGLLLETSANPATSTITWK